MEGGRGVFRVRRNICHKIKEPLIKEQYRKGVFIIIDNF